MTQLELFTAHCSGAGQLGRVCLFRGQVMKWDGQPRLIERFSLEIECPGCRHLFACPRELAREIVLKDFAPVPAHERRPMATLQDRCHAHLWGVVGECGWCGKVHMEPKVDAPSCATRRSPGTRPGGR